MRESVSSSLIASVTTEGEMPSMAAAALIFSAFCHRDEIADLPKGDQRHKSLRSNGAVAFGLLCL